VDFALSPDQSDLVDSVRTLLERHAGPARARLVEAERGGYDGDLLRALIDAGFADPTHAGATPLEAELSVELVAKAVGCAPFACRALVAPAILGDPIPDVVVVFDETANAEPVRFAAQAEVFLTVRGDQVIRIPRADVTVLPLESAFGYPIGRISGKSDSGEVVAGADPTSLWAWSRVALAAELVGLLDGALSLTVEHVTARRQFGHPLGSLQAVQHLLAELYFQIDGARWLARRAAVTGALSEVAAATTAAVGAARALGGLHQVSGAMGLTREYDLFLWTLRALALRQEASRFPGPASMLALARWGTRTAVTTAEGR
jgi:alkylation response protein AidB-like acyl-CoA dehydrogenase